VTKPYDGKPTNIIVRVDNPKTAVVRYSYDGEFFYEVGEFPGYTTVTNKAPVWFEAKDPEGNFRTITNRAFVTITKKNLGGGGGDPDENSIVADDKSIAYGDACPELTWHGGKGLADGDAVKSVALYLQGGADASTLKKNVYTDYVTTNATLAQAIVITNAAGADVTFCYDGFFTPGDFTVNAGGMTIGPGKGPGDDPVTHPPAPENPLPPADPDNEDTWNNGARSVTKEYDGKPTNIIVRVDNPKTAVVRYSYDGEEFYEAGEFPGYTTVTNKAPVWFEAKDPEGNFRTITNRAFVTILKKKLDDDDKNPDNAIVADDKSIAYGDACPKLTWHGGKGLVAGDSVRSVPLALKGGAVASELAKGVYTGLVSTNAAIVIVNSKGVDVTDCYEGFFKPGTLTVDSAAIRYEIEVPNVPYDGKGTNVTVTLITEEDPPFKLKYRGPDTPEGVWLDEPPVYTNAGPYDVTYVIEDGDNYTPVTNTVTMIISPRKITLKSPSKEKTYDGEPLELFADEIAAGGMGFADGERFDFTSLASTKEVGSIKASFAYGDGSAELANYDIVGFEYGTLRVNPNDEQIVVRSASGTWTYDGEAHSTNDFAIIGEENLYEGDWVKAELKLNSVTTPDDGDVTNEFKTAKIYRGPKDDVAGSTEVTKQYGEKFRIDEGLLNVVNAKFSDPVITSYRDLYDGKDHGIGVDKPQVDGVEIKYPDGNVFRDVTNATVRFVISAPYYDDYVGESTVEILPREVVFTTYDDIKEYDETPLETPKNIDVGGDGFIDGEGYEVSGRDSQTEVGRTDAGFEYQLLSNTKTANYRIRMVKGSLTVYDKDKLTVIATNAVHVYDGREYSNHDFTIKNPPAGCTVTPTFADSSAITYPGEVANRIVSVKIMKGADDVTADYEAVLIDGKLRVTAAKIEGVEVASTNLVYDGEGHSIVVTVPPEYANPVIEYSTTGREGPYQPKNPVFTIADPKGNPNEVYVRITVPGYEEYVTNGYVTITRRPVTVASEDASKKYDGEALSNDCVNVIGEIGLAAGERLFAVTTASQTGVGSTENAFDYVIADASGSEERTKNYDVTIVNGKLEVSPADITPWDPFGPDMGDEPTGPWVWVDAATMVYDGKSGTNVVIRYGNFAEGLPLFQYRPEGTMEFLDFDQAFTNVMYDADGKVRSTNVIVRFTGDANYRSQTLTNKVTILPGGMTIGPGPGPGDKPVVNPPGGQPPIPPADPEDENSWTNGARSVTKHWDGNPTNIIVRVDDPKDGAKIEYSYDGKTWMPEDEFPGYTDVIENGPVWFKITAPNYQPITNCAFVTILRPEAAQFAASLKWQYSGAATFFASLDVINVNENAFQYDEGTMRFCFADREDAGFWLWEFVKGGVNDRLATTIDLEMEGGSVETLRAFKLEDPEFGWLVGMDQHYGPEAGENLTFVQAFEKYNGATPQLYSRSRTATESALDGFVGYLVWEAYGETNSIPLYAGDELPLPRETVKPAKKAVSVARMNESAAYGLNVDSEGATTCEIIDFAVSGDRVNGKIRTGNGVSTGVPSASAKVTIEGTDELGGAADWSGEEVKTSNGEFEINRSHRFYRVRIGVGQEIFK